MAQKPLSRSLKNLAIPMLTEIRREAELYLSAQLTAAIAADQRAYAFAGTVTAGAVVLVGASYATATSTPPSVFLSVTATLVAGALFVSALVAVLSARSIDFEFCGNQPKNWSEDAEKKISFKVAIAEQCEHYDEMIACNSIVMQKNSQFFNRAVYIALVGLGMGGVAFLFWLFPILKSGLITALNH